MSSNIRDRNTPQIAYDSVQNLLKIQDDDSAIRLQSAVGMCYNYLTQKKLQWGIYLEKLMELFLDLAFDTQKHSKIKQVLKSYRAVTQIHHPDSLKSILEYYRDIKLQQILDEQIDKESIPSIREMKNIQDDEPSSQIIISSFNSQTKNKKQQIKANLKIVWDGYKTIIDTVRYNQKLEGVYRSTIKKIFQFVDTYNRKHEFKSFCQYLRLGLKTVLSKRGDKTQQQKGFYIDIQKQQVNSSNIEIRLQQFDLSSKLGLWQQSFQVLEDIDQIMKVKKGPVKNSLRCAYFQRLALIFKKSSYWHYHAYAFLNFYSIYITKSKLSQIQRTKIADKLILSVLCIPPSTLQSHQSLQSQKRIASMMIASKKIPDKTQLEEMMVSRGVVEAASNLVRQLWYFMFLDFDLGSLDKGLKLLDAISKEGQYREFIQLLEEILIYKQLISVAQVYQRIKYDSLISIIPLPKQKIEKVMLQCHQRKVIDFVLDQRQGIIIFEDQLEETNPYQQLLSCYIDVAILHEDNRKYDRQFIIKKTINFMESADNYYNNERLYKIDEFKKKLKKPKQQLQQKQRQRQKKIQQQRRHQQLLKRQKQAEQKKQEQLKRQQFIEKSRLISKIIQAKKKRVFTIGGKRVEQLTDQEIMLMDKQMFEEAFKEITQRVANDKEKRNKARFTKVDYLERERRVGITEMINKLLSQQNKQKQQFEKVRQLAKADFQQKQKLKQQIQKIAPEVKTTIDEYYNKNRAQYEENQKKFKQNLTQQFKKKIINKARQLRQQVEKKKKEDEQKRLKEHASQSTQMWGFRRAPVKTAETDGKWGRKKVQQSGTQSQASTNATTKKDNKGDWSMKKGPMTGGTIGNKFGDLKIDNDEKPKGWMKNKGEDKTQQKKDEGKWLGKKINQEKKQEKKQQKVEQTQVKKEQKPAKFVAPVIQNSKKFVVPSVESTSTAESKGAWGKGKATNTTTGNITSTAANGNTNADQQSSRKQRQQPELTFKKKDDKKPTKGKGW